MPSDERLQGLLYCVHRWDHNAGRHQTIGARPTKAGPTTKPQHQKLPIPDTMNLVQNTKDSNDTTEDLKIEDEGDMLLQTE